MDEFWFDTIEVFDWASSLLTWLLTACAWISQYPKASHCENIFFRVGRDKEGTYEWVLQKTSDNIILESDKKDCNGQSTEGVCNSR